MITWGLKVIWYADPQIVTFFILVAVIKNWNWISLP